MRRLAGSMIAGMADLIGNERKCFLVDSFEGLPEAKPVDGQRARDWMRNNEIDSCGTEESYAQEVMEMAGVSSVHIVKGWFGDTLPGIELPNGIAILRLDADWYSSTAECLNHLYDKVVPGGMIVFDDYLAWAGCSKALHDFLSLNRLEDRIRTVDDAVCYVEKIKEVSVASLDAYPDGR